MSISYVLNHKGETMEFKKNVVKLIILNMAVFMALINVFADKGVSHGPVRVKYLYYTNSQGEKGTTTYIYNRSGDMYKSVWKLDDDSRNSQNIYRYDEKGRMVEFYREFSDNIFLNEFYEYDKDGRRKADYFFRSDGRTGSAVYEYDKKGNLTYLHCKGYKLWFSGDLKYSHDKNGRVEGAEIWKEGNVIGKIIFKYDEYGNLTEEHWDFNGQWNQHFIYAYEKVEKKRFYLASPYIENKDSYRVKQEEYSYSDKSKGPSFYNYSKDGLLDKKVYERSDGLKTETAFEYDKNGKLIKSYRKSSDENNIEFTYTYDNRGNMTERKYFQKGVMSGYETYIYDENDNLVKAVYKNMDSWLSGTIFFEKDLFDRIVRGVYVGFDGLNAEIAFMYDDKGRTISIEWTFKDGKTQKYSFEYEELN